METPGTDKEAIVGEECHIVSQSRGGPRWRSIADAEVDEYANLVLLCRNHHKLVDDQPETFTEEVLRLLKANHERWVTTSLAEADRSERSGKRVPVRLLTSGEEAFEVVAGVHASDYGHDPLTDDREVELVKTFLQSAHDWGELFQDMEPGDHVEARYRLGKQLEELRQAGFLVYGNQRSVRMRAGNQIIDDWRIATLRLLRKTNPNVPPHHRAWADRAVE